jgi:hypothetical protein
VSSLDGIQADPERCPGWRPDCGSAEGGFVTKLLLTMDDTWGTVWVRRSNQASAEALDLGLFGHVAIVEFGQL